MSISYEMLCEKLEISAKFSENPRLEKETVVLKIHPATDSTDPRVF